MTSQQIPTESGQLDARHLLDMMDVKAGEELWVPVSTIHGNRFRAVKVRVLDRVSVNHYEEHHAVDTWPKADRLPIAHEVAEGYDGLCSDDQPEQTIEEVTVK